VMAKKTNKTEQVLKMISKEDDPENTGLSEMPEEPFKAPSHRYGKEGEPTILINVAEQMVKENIREVMERMNVCTCQVCTNDIAALALNTLPQKYITTNTGKQFTQIDIYKKQYETDVLAALTKACVRVKAGPRHV
jgi:competence protein ComFB